jgi:hypothetical protein
MSESNPPSQRDPQVQDAQRDPQVQGAQRDPQVQGAQRDPITPPVLLCVNHPDRETHLRCNRCEQPICPACAVLTPTGYRCKNCVRTQRKVFETAVTWDYPLAFVTAGVLSFLGSLVVPVMGFFTLFLAPIAGVIIAGAIRLVVRRHRSQRLYQLSLLAVVLSSLPMLALALLSMLASLSLGDFNVFAALPLLYRGLYVIMVASTTYYRLAGIQLNL